MNQAQDKYGHTRKVLLVLLSILAVIPLAPLINRYIPPLYLATGTSTLLFPLFLPQRLLFLHSGCFAFYCYPP